MKKVVGKFEVEYIQVMDEEGAADAKLMPKLKDSQVRDMYETMVLVRTFDDKAFSMQRQGRIGSYLQVRGQEASQVGAVMALKDQDFLFPMYRSTGALIARKQPLDQMLLYWGGDERGLISPKGVKNFPIAIPVGTQIAHASGSAWASKIQGKKDVSLALFGDGATSKSEFHTGLNFAGKYGAPAIFVCENNQYAISTPISHQTKSETIAQKAIGYGIKGIQVDGNDIFAVYSVVKEAVDNARKGKGPTLVEALTYRIGDHSTSDDAARYRSKEEVEKWKKKDPIERLEKYMKKKKILSDKQKAEIQKRALDQVEKAVERYENYPAAKKDDIFTYMFDKMPQQLQEQYDEWRRQ